MSGSCFAEVLSALVDLTPLEKRALERLEERQRHVRRGAVLQREKEVCGELFILRKGPMMSYVLLDDGSRQILRFLFPGDMLGVSSAIYREAPETMCALYDCVVSPFERSVLADLMVEHLRLSGMILVYSQIERALARAANYVNRYEGLDLGWLPKSRG